MKASIRIIASKINRVLRKSLRILLVALIVYAVVIAIVVWQSGDDDFQGRLHDYVVNDITELNPIPMASMARPAARKARLQSLVCSMLAFVVADRASVPSIVQISARFGAMVAIG